jgi:anti-sigma factor RsiW
MRAMTCADLGNVASELALDILYGEERAAALAHLETCRACRREVSLLTDAADEIRLLVPEVEPPAGFEQGVVARIAAAAADQEATAPLVRTPRRRRPLVRALAAAAAMVALVAASVLVLSGGGDGEDVAAARTATMRTATGQVVGDATLSADPAAIVVDVPDWASLVNSYRATVDATYWLAVEDGEGTRALERLPPVDEHPWTITLDVPASTVAAVSIVDNGGTVWCTARFSPAGGQRG